ncbi:MAG: hypothetical protein V4438_01945 [Patescibacteria group bacterium]
MIILVLERETLAYDFEMRTKITMLPDAYEMEERRGLDDDTNETFWIRKGAIRPMGSSKNRWLWLANNHLGVRIITRS